MTVVRTVPEPGPHAATRAHSGATSSEGPGSLPFPTRAALWAAAAGVLRIKF